jgi:hypothetical protein
LDHQRTEGRYANASECVACREAFIKEIGDPAERLLLQFGLYRNHFFDARER